jgi:type VI secretion system secreted protein Hcp
MNKGPFARIRKSAFAGVLAGACVLGFGATLLSGPASGDGPASLHRGSAPQSRTSKNALLTALLSPAASTAGDPIFMKVPGVVGDSTDASHPGWINLRSWNVAFQNPNALGGPTGGVSNPTASSLTASLAYSQASPPLLADLATGQHLSSIQIEHVKAGPAGELTYLTIVLSDVAITNISDSAAAAGSPTETISLNFSQIAATFTPQNADGTAGSPVSFCFNFMLKRGC